LALFPEFFAPTQPDWPPHVHHAGPISWDPPVDAEVARSLETFLDPSRKPIVVLAGSAGPESAGFYQTWINAAKQVNRQLILLERNQNLVPQGLPDHVFHATYFPIDDILDRAVVIAHSGGVGSTLRSLAAGVPQIVCPKVNDQPDNAHRVVRLGVGKILHPSNPRVEAIATQLNNIIDNQTILSRCRNCQTRFPEIDATEYSCDLIETTFDKYRT
jgi:rhamnosyltransferase subunit B